jgi:hypothetical protein
MSCFPPEGTRRLTIFSFRNIRQTTAGLENHFQATPLSYIIESGGPAKLSAV